MHTIAEALAVAQQKLSCSDTPRLDAEVLLAVVLQQDRAYLYTWPERVLVAGERRVFMEWIERRAQGEPVAYISGYRDFWSLTLQVDCSTLIPRPETELLVELALQRLPETPCQVLDLGTGSGAIALALASEREAWHVWACDLSDAALKLAARNAQSLRISNVGFFYSHWFDEVREKSFDLIVSNPPYIDEMDKHLLCGDVRFEPVTALVAGKQGLADLECIIAQSKFYLKPQAYLMLEHGYRQGEQVRTCMRQYGYSAIETFPDLAGCERVTLCQWQAGT